ncbi:DUF2459 domain-containing protein [Lichenicoccus sp.]|uniref:DUF2459 domain-containing protein n=1 Tax=Lichenicoccus sp. TaxID=2781899 RepID=UPI003D152B62
MLAGCAAGSPAALPTRCLPALRDEVTIVDSGWHTALALPARELTGGLGIFRRIFPGGSTYVFGFGKRTFMIAPANDLSEWLLGPFPGPGAIQVEALSAPAAIAYASPVRTVTLALQPGEVPHLAGAIWAGIDHDRAGQPTRIAARPWHGTLFYASTHGYGMAYTCNAWTAAMLHAAGVPIDASGVVLAGQVMHRVGRVAECGR